MNIRWIQWYTGIRPLAALQTMFMQIREINDPIRTIMILQHPLATLHYREASKEEVLDIYLFPTHEILEKEGKTLTLLCAGGGRFVKKTSRKYNFPHTKNNLRHYFYFLPVRVSNIMKFWFVCSVNWVLSAVFLQPFFQNSLLFAKQTLFGLV